MENGFNDLENLNVEGKKVLLRVGMDVSVDKDGNILDDSRIVSCIPTLQHLIDRKAKLILMMHIGRPGGQVVENLKTDRVAERLSRFMFRKIDKMDGLTGDTVRERIERMEPGEMVFLDNLRFDPGEESNDDNFTEAMASLGDAYVNECFSVSHRNHSSMVGLPARLPSAAGFCLRKEVEEIGRVVENPERPFVAVLGGVKADKLNALKTLCKKADKILIGGGLSFAFLRLMGIGTGKSKIDSKWLDAGAEEFMKSTLSNEKIVLPSDFVVADEFDAESGRVVGRDSIPEDGFALDIGPETVSRFKDILGTAKTIVWAGPMGVFERKGFENGTRELAGFMANSGAVSIVGGGESASAAEKFNLADRFTHVSTGGGAFLDFLANGSLPAIDALRESALKFGKVI
ncbi:MAG: phosphoglycerate kinase [Candidatus Aenigmarchaeota archaeon]|nr:phosphoglycerate kinase [Candidatus Aenigmarchaeota archaeon]